MLRGISFSTINPLILAAVSIVYPLTARAQRHGGGGAGATGLSGISRPTGLDEKDTLKDFHEALAVQANAQQITEFQALIKTTEAAKAELEALAQQLTQQSATANSSGREPLDQAIAKARSANKQFQDGFSAEQKSGLKEITKRLAKSDSDLEQEEKKIDQSFESKLAASEISPQEQSLDKALTDFSDQQLDLGREMGITLATDKDLTYALPSVKRPASLANQTILIPVSGDLTQTSAEAGQRILKLELIAGLSDLQQNITQILKAELDRSETCGQRTSIQQATLSPASPAGLLVVQLHFERWTCIRIYGQQSENELGEGDGTVNIKITTAVGESNALKVASQIDKIDANGMMEDALRNGSLGERLRERVTSIVFSALRVASDLKAALPSAVQNSAAIQSAGFLDDGVHNLSLSLTGQVRISDAQAKQLATQLNQSLSAQGIPPK